jgi:hypothetical protein
MSPQLAVTTLFPAATTNPTDALMSALIDVACASADLLRHGAEGGGDICIVRRSDLSEIARALQDVFIVRRRLRRGFKNLR